MTRIGRNEPCPCGSGKKYKRCCLGKDDVGPATAIEEVDSAVTGAAFDWIARQHRNRVDHVGSLLEPHLWEAADAAGLLMQLGVWETPSEDGEPLCLQIPERLRRRLDPREQDWLAEQQGSWFSLWDVIEVREDEGLFLRDLLTGEERFVRERSATHYVDERSVMLARIVRLGKVWTLAACHPQQLPPHTAEDVATDARAALKLGRGKVDPARLRGEAAFRLVTIWDTAVEDLALAPRPELRNTEGDPLVLTEDHFSFRAVDRDAVLARMRQMSELEEDDEEEEDDDDLELVPITFHRMAAQDDDGQRLHLASIEVSDLGVVIETNSTRRADETRALLEAILSDLLRFLDRFESDYWDDMDADDDVDDGFAGVSDEDALPPEEAAPLILEFKTRHYASWPDTPLPALGGLTPRDAAADKRKKVYGQLDIVLREIERGESLMPFEQRYDVGILRRELGM